MKAVLDLFPMPPTENNLYPTVRVGGRLIRVASGELKRFRRDCSSWALARGGLLPSIREFLKQRSCDEHLMIRVDAYFGFHYERLFTKKGGRKKMDASNRIKALHDVLADLLGVDDRYFFSGVSEPVLLVPSEPECVMTVLTIQSMRDKRTAVQTVLLGSSSSPDVSEKAS